MKIMMMIIMNSNVIFIYSKKIFFFVKVSVKCKFENCIIAESNLWTIRNTQNKKKTHTHKIKSHKHFSQFVDRANRFIDVSLRFFFYLIFFKKKKK